MNFTKHRFEIWSQTQHPYKHSLADFGYTNPALPGVATLEGALNWAFSVLYPQAKAPVNTVGDLPLVGNTLNDYRVVYDDGDGKAASYRWEQREGDVTPLWYKVYDMDWGQDSILSGFLVKTQDVYVYKYGYDDTDVSGAPLTGLTGGQHVYGGASVNTHLTLHANSGDGTGVNTGFIQFADSLRPTTTGINIGTAALKFQDIHLSGVASIDTLTISTGSIVDSTGTISFDNENLITTGNVTANILFSTTAEIGQLNFGTNQITSDVGVVSLVGNDLITSGDIQAATFTLSDGTDNLTMSIIPGDGVTLVSTLGTIYFNGLALLGISNAETTDLTVSNQALIGGLVFTGYDINSTGTNTDINILDNGTGLLNISRPSFITANVTMFGVLDVTGSLGIDDITINGTVISSDSDLTIAPVGAFYTLRSITPVTDAVPSLGSTTLRFNTLHLSNAISDGTVSIGIATLMSLRSINSGASAGMSLFYDGSQWLASFPDLEITHSTITGLTTGDAGHTQFVMLAGRATGQTVSGGNAASENLTLDSTSHATKGSIFIGSPLRPLTDASYSGSWNGIDIGGSTRYFKDVYTKGEFFGLRLQNVTSGTLPTASTQNMGRLVFATDNSRVYVDNGTSLVAVGGVSKFISDTSWDGIETFKVVTVSGIADARNAIWQLVDNANDFDRIYCSIKAISSTQVRIEANVALPAGAYRLIGLE